MLTFERSKSKFRVKKPYFRYPCQIWWWTPHIFILACSRKSFFASNTTKLNMAAPAAIKRDVFVISQFRNISIKFCLKAGSEVLKILVLSKINVFIVFNVLVNKSWVKWLPVKSRCRRGGRLLENLVSP